MLEADLVDGQVADDGLGVGLERGLPLRLVLRVAPLGSLGLDELLGALLEGQSGRLCAAAVAGARVDPGADQFPAVAHRFAGLGQGLVGVAPEPDLGPLALPAEPEQPRLAAGLRNVQEQAVAIGVQPGVFDVAAELRRQ